MRAWTLLAAAILLEVSGTTFLKQSQGFTRMGPALAMALCCALSPAVRRIEIGVVGLNREAGR
ncbi:MAG TPA: SMR family transporter [Gammaproteobacteria bacterium]|nr:SMR family transporter [Gammaproteobacteria bacterium]